MLGPCESHGNGCTGGSARRGLGDGGVLTGVLCVEGERVVVQGVAKSSRE